MLGLSTALVPFFPLVVAPLATHAFALRREQKLRQFWLTLTGSAAIAVAAAMYMDTDPEVDLIVRLPVLGFLGGILGASAVMWAGYAISDWRASAQTTTQKNESTQMSEPTNPHPPPPHINAPNNSGIIAPNNQGSITQNINPAAPRDEMKFYQNDIAVATLSGGEVTATGHVIISELYNSGELDPSKPVEFRNFIIRLTKFDRSKGTLMSFRNGSMVNNIIPDIEGQIIGRRGE